MLNNDDLKERWHSTEGCQPHTIFAFDVIKLNYSDSHRKYHNLDHLDQCFRLLDELVGDGVKIYDPQSLEQAIWFHDIVYNPAKLDNEINSARLAQLYTDMKTDGFGTGKTKPADMILLTKDHTVAQQVSDDTALFLDIDLSILGQPEQVFDQYCDNIRLEYGFVPEEQYNQGRKKVLDKFLNMEYIYRTPWFRSKFESQARMNLKRSMAQLSDHLTWHN